MMCKYCKKEITQSRLNLNYRIVDGKIIIDALHNCGQYLGTTRLQLGV